MGTDPLTADGSPEPVLFDSEEAAQIWALKAFGSDAGKEYAITEIAPSTTESKENAR